MSDFSPMLDLFPLAAAILAAVTCGLLGNHLLLRGESLMGDAISHGVLPGLVVGFLLTGSRTPQAMLSGAAVAGILTVLLILLVRRTGRVEPGAAMGVVFSILFAIGVILIEVAARQTDLDADCVLHGQLETLAWYDAPTLWTEVPAWATVEAIPRQVWTLLVAFMVSLVFVVALFKELRLVAFDRELASTLGFRPRLIEIGTMILVALATVASFEAVGSILVIAMLVCPAAIARLLTDRMSTQVLLSGVLSVSIAVIGYRAATVLPGWFERDSVNAAGSMAVTAGLLLVLAVVLAPRHGVLGRWLGRIRSDRRIAIDDLLARLWRLEEQGDASTNIAFGPAASTVVRAARRRGLVEHPPGASSKDCRLTASGRTEARRILRRHRLWETYLVDEAGLAPDHVHDAAELLEHLETTPTGSSSLDPHGKAIPEEDPPEAGDPPGK